MGSIAPIYLDHGNRASAVRRVFLGGKEYLLSVSHGREGLTVHECGLR